MNRVRFAPSPTGYIHIGNARVAILNVLFARKTGGEFILRYDDTDTQRSTDVFADAIAADLAWLGIVPDHVERQSARVKNYEAAMAHLRTSGRLYPCYETATELDRRRARQRLQGAPPIYDRAALNLSEADRARLEAEGRRPHWRFRLEGKPVEWNDLVRGPQSIDTASLSDPVLVREDGTFLYTLPSVVDDVDFGISHVIRGEDHVVNTAVQIEIFRALGSEPPQFAHASLLVGVDGKGLSKRLGSLGIGDMRAQGLEPMAVVSLCALIGTSDAIHPCTDMSELVAGFDLHKLGRAPARFDEAELRALNAKVLHHEPWEKVRAKLGFGSEAFWLAVRGNLEKLSDARQWYDVIHEPLVPVAEAQDRAFLAIAEALLPPAPWDHTTWKIWTDAVKAATDRKGRALFLPLRLALTGLEHGPELAALLPLMAPEEVRTRLAQTGAGL